MNQMHGEAGGDRRPGVNARALGAPRDERALALWQAYMDAAASVLDVLPVAEREDLLMELTSHLAVSAATGPAESSEADRMQAAMKRLGTPREYLRPLIADSLLERGVAGYQPLLLARGLYQNLFGGVKALVLSGAFTLGYVVLLSLAVIALFKPVFPRHIGYFIYPDGARAFGIIANADGARDPLGYWIIPIALAGVAVLFVTLTNALRVVRRKYVADRTQ
jgi:hypothetical protein